MKKLKKYIIKLSKKKILFPYCENNVLSTSTISLRVITPSFVIFILSTIDPEGSTIAEIPLFADLKVYLPFSIDLKIL